jgi:rhomboid family GlyGly-CTERM serine protease
MFNLPIQIQHIVGPLSILFIALGLYMFEPTSGYWLAYDRTAIEDLQLWRLLSANFLHTNFNHLLLNVAGLILLWALHGEYYRPLSYIMVFICCSLGCTVGIYLFAQQLNWYVGLSGTLHGMFIWGAYLDIRHKVFSGWVLLGGVWLKIAYEQIEGPSVEVAKLINANVATEAHLFGAISAILVILVHLIRLVLKKPQLV